MKTHFSILAWEIPWVSEPGGLQPTIVHKGSAATEHTHASWEEIICSCYIGLGFTKMMTFFLSVKEPKCLCRRKMKDDNVDLTALSILWKIKIDPILVNASTIPGKAAF